MVTLWFPKEVLRDILSPQSYFTTSPLKILTTDATFISKKPVHLADIMVVTVHCHYKRIKK
jgi:hypothetical protein